MDITPIAHIHSSFPTKFGIPRQSGLAPATRATVVFEDAFAIAEALRGLEAFTHLWLIWGFSEALRDGWSPTVRPPRLGGNTRLGVFATRSPFRPNPSDFSGIARNTHQPLPFTTSPRHKVPAGNGVSL